MGPFDGLPIPKRAEGDSGERQLSLPRVFIGGRFMGGAEKIQQLHEFRELKKFVEGVPPVEAGVCECCGEGRLGRDGLWAVDIVGVAPGEDGRAGGEVGDENQWLGTGKRRRRQIERRCRRVEAKVDADLDAAPLEGN